MTTLSCLSGATAPRSVYVLRFGTTAFASVVTGTLVRATRGAVAAGALPVRHTAPSSASGASAALAFLHMFVPLDLDGGSVSGRRKRQTRAHPVERPPLIGTAADVASTCPAASSACTAIESAFVSARSVVSNPAAFCGPPTGSRLFVSSPASTCHDSTPVAPFQLG